MKSPDIPGRFTLTNEKRGEVDEEQRELDTFHVVVLAESHAGTQRHTPAEELMREAMTATSPGLSARADSMWSTANELTRYLDGSRGAEVLTAAAHLRGQVIWLVDPVPGTAMSTADMRVFAGLGFAPALAACVDLAERLDATYWGVARYASKPLRDRIAQDAAFAERMDATRRMIREACEKAAREAAAHREQRAQERQQALEKVRAELEAEERKASSRWLVVRRAALRMRAGAKRWARRWGSRL